MKKKYFSLLKITFACSALLLASSAQASLIASSSMENNREWTLGTTNNSFLPGGVGGLIPTVGDEMMVFETSYPGMSGTNFIV
ncbi:MAG: hypothetical protein ACWA5X_04645 [bacterium]